MFSHREQMSSSENNSNISNNNNETRRSIRKIKPSTKIATNPALLNIFKKSPRIRKNNLMSKSCCFVKNCRGKKSVDRRLHMLPSNMVIRNIWLRNCNIASMVEVGNTVNNVKICSDHFEDHMYSKPENKKKLRRNAIPTLFNNSNEPETTISLEDNTSKPINRLISDPQFELPASVALSSSAEIVKYNTVPSQIVNFTIHSNTEEFDQHYINVKNFVYNVIVSNSFWKVVQQSDDSILIALIQFKDFMGLEKKVVFKKNSLQPEIYIDGRFLPKGKYIMNERDLQELLDTLDDYEICFGNNGDNHTNCDGHYLMNASNIDMCCHCATLTAVDNVKQKSIAQKSRNILALYTEVCKLSNRSKAARE